MSMLAERRRKQRWSLNPRGNDWSKDSNKFGQKLMERMGWKHGKGLGANEDGLTEHIRIAYKNDSKGVGFKESMEWSAQQDNFSALLEQLSNTKTDAASETERLKSLEEKSQSSRARLHYKKFTRGKDLSKRSEKDLANIFGKKKLTKSEVKEESDKEAEDVKEVPLFGVTTFTGGSMIDYFKNKKFNGLSTRNRKISENSASDENITYGFGFKSETSNDDTNLENDVTVNDDNAETIHDSQDSYETKKKKRKSKNKSENDAQLKNGFLSYINGNSLGNSNSEFVVTPKKRKNEIEIESNSSKSKKQKHESSDDFLKCSKKKKHKKDHTEDLGLINPAFDPLSRNVTVSKTNHVLDTIKENDCENCPDDLETSGMEKKKCKKKSDESITSNSINFDSPVMLGSTKSKKSKSKSIESLENNSDLILDTTNDSAAQNLEELQSIKKKKKKKSKQLNGDADAGIENPNFAFENPDLAALNDSEINLEQANPYEVKPKKKKKKKQTDENTYDNPNLDLDEDLQSSTDKTSAEYEVKRKDKRKEGLDNPALDLNDSTPTENVPDPTADCDIMLNVIDEPVVNTSTTSKSRESSSKRKSVRFNKVIQERTYLSGEIAERYELYNFNTQVIKDGLKDLHKKKKVPDFDYSSIDRIDFCDDGISRKQSTMGLDNHGFDARANNIEESVDSLTRNIEMCQAEVENGINESKDSHNHRPAINREFMVGELNNADGENEKHHEGVTLRYKYAQLRRNVPAWVKSNDMSASWPKKSYRHLIRGDIIVGFKNSNLHEINGYGVTEQSRLN